MLCQVDSAAGNSRLEGWLSEAVVRVGIRRVMDRRSSSTAWCRILLCVTGVIHAGRTVRCTGAGRDVY